MAARWLAALAVGLTGVLACQAPRPAMGIMILGQERPEGARLSDDVIQAATHQLRSSKAEERVDALDLLCPYFGPALVPGTGVCYMYTHKPSAEAYAALREPQAVALLLQCLTRKERFVRLWAINRLSIQKQQSNAYQSEESTIKALVEADGLIARNNRQKVAVAMKPLLDDPDPYVKAETLEAATQFFPDDAYGIARKALADTSPIVRARAWRLISGNYHTWPCEPSPTDKYLLKQLKAALADPHDSVVSAALGFVSTAGFNTFHAGGQTMFPGPGLSDREEYKGWRALLDACEPPVLAAADRPGRIRDVPSWHGLGGDKIQEEVIQACRFYPDTEEFLIRALDHPAPLSGVRCYAVESLGEIGKEKALKALEKMQKRLGPTDRPNSHDWLVRDALKRSLKAIRKRGYL